MKPEPYKWLPHMCPDKPWELDTISERIARIRSWRAEVCSQKPINSHGGWTCPCSWCVTARAHIRGLELDLLNRIAA